MSAWIDTLSSPINSDSIRYRVKAPFIRWSVGDMLTVWQQGERFININGLLTAFSMADVLEWEQAELIVRW